MPADLRTDLADAPPEVVQELTPAREIAWLLQRLDLAQRTTEQQLSMSSAEMRLLWLFTDGRPRTLREIAEALGLEQSTVNRQVNGALSSGLLRRDRRPGVAAQLVSATRAGSDKFEHELDLVLGRYDAALQALSDRQQTQFLRQLAIVVGGYENAVRRHDE